VLVTAVAAQVVTSLLPLLVPGARDFRTPAASPSYAGESVSASASG